ncbi:methyltransferase dimerization domain-containing protein [Streptomyces sp. MCL20-2]|uniref:methyltransferase family protein n=1 Tax=Streptomyces sp. MCL20-2 TaxID=2967219 RepID=UPI00398FACD4
MTGGQDQETRTSEDAPVGWQARGALSRLVVGQMATQALGTAVRFDVFDRIGPVELTADALAESLGTHPQATLRLLRALAGLQLLSETEPGLFRTSAAGDFLRTDTAGSMAAMARMFTDPVMLRGWARRASARAEPRSTRPRGSRRRRGGRPRKA